MAAIMMMMMIRSTRHRHHIILSRWRHHRWSSRRHSVPLAITITTRMMNQRRRRGQIMAIITIMINGCSVMTVMIDGGSHGGRHQVILWSIRWSVVGFPATVVHFVRFRNSFLV